MTTSYFTRFTILGIIYVCRHCNLLHQFKMTAALRLSWLWEKTAGRERIGSRWDGSATDGELTFSLDELFFLGSARFFLGCALFSWISLLSLGWALFSRMSSFPSDELFSVPLCSEALKLESLLDAMASELCLALACQVSLPDLSSIDTTDWGNIEKVAGEDFFSQFLRIFWFQWL